MHMLLRHRWREGERERASEGRREREAALCHAELTHTKKTVVYLYYFFIIELIA
jgi:hypothetical protein